MFALVAGECVMVVIMHDLYRESPCGERFILDTFHCTPIKDISVDGVATCAVMPYIKLAGHEKGPTRLGCVEDARKGEVERADTIHIGIPDVMEGGGSRIKFLTI